MIKGWIRHSLAAGAGALLVLGGAAAGMAQTQGSTAPAAPANTTAAPPATQQEQPPKTLQMVPAQAQLDTSLDAKKAKQGQEVRAKLEENVTIPDADPLPKNTVLEGHVDQVTPSQNKSDSTMVVTFDKVKLKDGQELPIKATVIAVAEPALPQVGGGGGGGAPAGGAMPAGGSAAPSGGGSSGGGMRGGGGAEPSAPSTPQQPMSAPDGGGSQPQAPANGVPDVTLTSNIHQHSSATFTSKGRNVHVPGGTEMQVAIAVIPPGTHLQ